MCVESVALKLIKADFNTPWTSAILVILSLEDAEEVDSAAALTIGRDLISSRRSTEVARLLFLFNKPIKTRKSSGLDRTTPSLTTIFAASSESSGDDLLSSMSEIRKDLASLRVASC